jgi:hypothetical protein
VTHPPLDSFGDPARAAADPHVRGCPTCQAELAVQREVRELLAGLPDPGPIPPDVVDRIRATLAGLAAQTVAEPPEDLVPTPVPTPLSTPEPAAASTVVPLAQAPSARRRRPLLAAAAAAVVLLGGGYVVSQNLGGTTDSGSAASSALQERSQGTPKVAELAAVPVLSSGTNYTTAGLQRQVSAQLSAAKQQGVRPDAAAGDDQLGALSTPTGLAGCLSALGDAGAVPQLVDVARFEGKPAAVIVLPSDDGGREVWVVATTCRPGQDGMKYFRSIR